MQFDDSQGFEIDFYCRAIAESYRMQPYRWLSRFGDLRHSGTIPPQHKHLKSEYREILLDMRSKVKTVYDSGVKPEFKLNTVQHFS
ncbi:hypothetical protein [Shewanella sp. NIFS-20-20]|uniref:hypothetical protein n=1 Tax=Shewanella sp. NIFS-20-20 TaxID=2853806 RepID=UPI001C450B5F|nr:hypothetical protein [Shewanella sp. NIFS-20-20]MBV7314760.1 hypothetical protein [Shewanella sp. NIFS-20-20]